MLNIVTPTNFHDHRQSVFGPTAIGFLACESRHVSLTGYRFSDLDVIIKNNESPEIACLVFFRLENIRRSCCVILAPPVILLPSVLMLLKYFPPPILKRVSVFLLKVIATLQN